MILVDTSIWIELLNGRGPKPSPNELLSFVTCGPVVQEVFRGLREGRMSEQFREMFLALPCLGDPMPRKTFQAAADIYREGRRRGLTVRSTVDCLIAAVAIEHQTPVWHRDRDFRQIAQYTPLRAAGEIRFGAGG